MGLCRDEFGTVAKVWNEENGVGFASGVVRMEIVE